MRRISLATFPSMLIAAAALLGGCALEPTGEPAELEGQTFELVDIGENGEGCFIVDDAGTMECFQTEAEADEQLLASLPADEDAAPTLQAAAPNCVTTYLDDDGWTDYLFVFNGCSYPVRVKVVLAYGTDLACHWYAAYNGRWWWWGWPKRFDGLVTC